MNPNEILRIVDSLHREKNIDTEIVFQAIEAAYTSAAHRQYGEEADILVTIDRESGELGVVLEGEPLDSVEMIGRIGAQMAKQVIIQKIREAERDSLADEYNELLDHVVSGTVYRVDGPMVTVQLPSVEAILPRSEQIPGESHHSNARIRAMVCDVRSQGTRIKVVLSRSRPKFVQRLFEQEIPEIADGVITVNAISREPAHRSKVAVSSSDQRIDCVGACVGVRGNRIKNIVDELSGERIDIVRWDDDPEVLIPNALQPAEVEQVLLCRMIGRAIVLVSEDQLSLAIGRRGQNVRLASKLCGWDIEIMTEDELGESIERAVMGFMQIDGMNEELAQALVEFGYLSYDDLSVIEPDDLMEIGELTAEQVDHIVEQAEKFAEEAEVAAKEERDRRKAEAALAAAQAAAAEAAGITAPDSDAGADAPTEEAQPATEDVETAKTTEATPEEAQEAEEEAEPEVEAQEAGEAETVESVADEASEEEAEVSQTVQVDTAEEVIAEEEASEEAVDTEADSVEEVATDTAAAEDAVQEEAPAKEAAEAQEPEVGDETQSDSEPVDEESDADGAGEDASAYGTEQDD